MSSSATSKSSSSSLDPLESAKKKAAYAAVNEFVADKQIIGIGSGSTVVYVVQRLAERVKEEKLSIICLPTSFQAKQLIMENKLTLGELNQYPELDITIDGADEVDDNLNLIKGGGGCQLGEKLLAYNSKKMIVVADYRKHSKLLSTSWKKGIPLEVLSTAYVPVLKRLSQLGGKPSLRICGASGCKAGPVVTDQGNFIIDVDFGPLSDPVTLDKQLHSIPGIVETGLFIGLAVKAFFGQKDGSVSALVRKQ
eukprot:TRINITY_DN705_c0_g1_i1.p1 TRINITY_DN705_c0_g1~~TRINITY_DN705_c0_g1_i1.p1  ORF type:complete len:252 (+),score=56.02 TRINITY_DN705_c0_g1_i1:57-812(+)